MVLKMLVRYILFTKIESPRDVAWMHLPIKGKLGPWDGVGSTEITVRTLQRGRADGRDGLRTQTTWYGRRGVQLELGPWIEDPPLQPTS